MTTDTKNDAYQNFALSFFLSEDPDLPYHETLEGIGVNDDILVWQPFKGYNADLLAEHIDKMADSARYYFAPRDSFDQMTVLVRDMLKDYHDGSIEGLAAYKRLEEILRGV